MVDTNARFNFLQVTLANKCSRATWLLLENSQFCKLARTLESIKEILEFYCLIHWLTLICIFLIIILYILPLELVCHIGFGDYLLSLTS